MKIIQIVATKTGVIYGLSDDGVLYKKVLIEAQENKQPESTLSATLSADAMHKQLNKATYKWCKELTSQDIVSENQ